VHLRPLSTSELLHLIVDRLSESAIKRLQSKCMKSRQTYLWITAMSVSLLFVANIPTSVCDTLADNGYKSRHSSYETAEIQRANSQHANKEMFLTVRRNMICYQRRYMESSRRSHGHLVSTSMDQRSTSVATGGKWADSFDFPSARCN